MLLKLTNKFITWALRRELNESFSGDNTTASSADLSQPGPSSSTPQPGPSASSTPQAGSSSVEFQTPEKDRGRLKKREEKRLRCELNRVRMTEEAMAKDDPLVTYLTGLPDYKFVKFLLKFVGPLKHKGNRRLTDFQEFMMCMVKLRLDVQFTHLAFTMNVDRRTVSRIFYRWIDLLYYRLKGFVFWPSREELRDRMPDDFKAGFGERLAVIIDCFEVHIERSGNPEMSGQTWSSYKHDNTLKFLIGITPHGHIFFVSRAYVGKSSDTFITEDSGILKNLLPGDIVLADRGYHTKESLEIYMGELNQPAFLRGQTQLDPLSVERTRKIANVRIHVERVIGLVRRKYKILSGNLPSTLLNNIDQNGVTYIDKIVLVCCALATNVDRIIY